MKCHNMKCNIMTMYCDKVIYNVELGDIKFKLGKYIEHCQVQCPHTYIIISIWVYQYLVLRLYDTTLHLFLNPPLEGLVQD